jgi:alkanesulfonate monooxygenase SsuD/methylene tetrahydromethanopterin reductase-like flavin-dependent oxidoreductase (luciferase family)
MQLATFEPVVPRQSDYARFLKEYPGYLHQIAQLGYSQVFFPHSVAWEPTLMAAPDLFVAAFAAQVPQLRFGIAGFNLRAMDPFSVFQRTLYLSAMFPGRIDVAFTWADTIPGIAKHHVDRATRDVVAEMVDIYKAGSPNFPSPPLYQVTTGIDRCRLAGQMGLGLITAYFGPESLPAIEAYREASAQPHLMVMVPAVCAETQAKADLLTQPSHMFYYNSRCNFMRGTPAGVKCRIEELAQSLGDPRIIITAPLFNKQRRLEAYGLLAREFGLH